MKSKRAKVVKQVLVLILIACFCLSGPGGLEFVQATDQASEPSGQQTAEPLETVDRALELARQSIFNLETVYKDQTGVLGLKGIGTALLISDSGYFLTLSSNLNLAYDLVGNLRTRLGLRLVHSLEDQAYDCKVLARDSELDLALLQVVGDWQGPGQALDLLGARKARLGEQFAHLGAEDPFNYVENFSPGYVTGLRPCIITETGLSTRIFESEAVINRSSLFGPAIGLDGSLLGVSIYKKDRLSYDRNSYFYNSETLIRGLQRILLRNFQTKADWAKLPQDLKRVIMLKPELVPETRPSRPSQDEEEAIEDHRAEAQAMQPRVCSDPEDCQTQSGQDKEQEDKGEDSEPVDDLEFESRVKYLQKEFGLGQYKIFVGLSFYADQYTERLAGRYGWQEGVLLAEINSQSPAYSSGLNSRDLVRSVNGKRVNKFEDLYAITSSLESGDLLTLEIRQGDGRTKEYRIFVKNALSNR